MKVTANGTLTSPVKRGVWVAERLLGIPIPPPPPNIEPVDPDTRGAKTLREQLALHSSQGTLPRRAMPSSIPTASRWKAST